MWGVQVNAGCQRHQFVALTALQGGYVPPPPAAGSPTQHEGTAMGLAEVQVAASTRVGPPHQHTQPPQAWFTIAHQAQQVSFYRSSLS